MRAADSGLVESAPFPNSAQSLYFRSLLSLLLFLLCIAVPFPRFEAPHGEEKLSPD